MIIIIYAIKLIRVRLRLKHELENRLPNVSPYLLITDNSAKFQFFDPIIVKTYAS